MSRMKIVPLACLALAMTAAPGLAEKAPQLSPLAKYPGFGHDAVADEAQFEAEEAAREEKIARCMERAGFMYRPMLSVNLESLQSAREAIAAMRDNPNDRYVLLLSQDGRLRYNRALYGVDDPNALEADALRSATDPTASGCAAEAFRAIAGVFSARSALAEEFIALRQAVLTDRRVASAEASWAACMSRRGYSLESPRALRRQMDNDLAQSSANPETLRQLGAAHQRALESSTGCVQAAGLQGVVAAVRMEKEAAFVKQHQELLDNFLKTLEQQSLEEE